MASMPHYLAGGVNELSAQGIEKAVNGLMQMLILTLTGVEEIVVFIINLLTSTYVCLITLAVSGSLHVAISVAEDVGNFLNSTAQDVGKDLSSATSDFQDAMNGFLSGISDIGDFFSGHDSKPPTIDLSGEIDKLNTLQLPTGYDQGLQTLNGSIPTFAQVQNLTNTAIRFPFEEVKKLLNESLPKYSFNGSMFPVPAKEQLTFCSDDNGVNDFFDDLVDIEQMAKKTFLGVIVTLAVLAMIPMAWREHRSWTTMNERAHLVKDHAYDSLDAVYIVSRPYTAGAGLWLARKFKSSRRRALVRWSVAYATTVPALFVLSLAIAGLLGCLCQYILLKSLEKEVPALENQVIGFSEKVINSLNNASEQWAVGTNNIITDTNNDINDDVFGWVNTTTGAVNNTLNVFVDEMTGALNNTFGGTVLYDPIMDVLNCLVLLKIQGIQKGLTWVSDHAKIDIPMLPNDTFSLGTAQKLSGSETNILATRSDGAAADAITDAVAHVVRAFASSIKQEAIISTCILLIWVIVALIGIFRGLTLFYRGGNTDTYHDQYPSGSSVSRDKSLELSEVPSYEQATGIPEAGNHRGNMYNGQSYTLTPAPMPTFEVTSATSPIMQRGFNPPNEKMGTVSGQNVDTAIRRPSHIRASSHGDYAVTSPMSPPQAHPFLSADEIQDQKRNPFSEPGR